MSDQRSQEALRDLRLALAALEKKRDQIHPDRFEIMTEPIREHIRRLERESAEETLYHCCPHCGGDGTQGDGEVGVDCPECGGDGWI